MISIKFRNKSLILCFILFLIYSAIIVLCYSKLSVPSYVSVFYKWTFKYGIYPRALIGTIVSSIPLFRNNIVLFINIFIFILTVVYFVYLYKCFKDNIKLLFCCFFSPFFFSPWIIGYPEMFHFVFLLVNFYLYKRIKNKNTLFILFTIIALFGIFIHNGYALLVFPFSILMLFDDDLSLKNIIKICVYCFVNFIWFVFLKFYMYNVVSDKYDVNVEYVIKRISDDVSTFRGDVADAVRRYFLPEFKMSYSIFSDLTNFGGIVLLLNFLVICFVYILVSSICIKYYIKIFNLIDIKYKLYKFLFILLFYIVLNIVGIDIHRWLMWYLNIFFMYCMYRYRTDKYSIEVKNYDCIIHILLNIVFLYIPISSVI